MAKKATGRKATRTAGKKTARRKAATKKAATRKAVRKKTTGRKAARKKATRKKTAAKIPLHAPRLEGVVFHFAGRLATPSPFWYEDLPEIARRRDAVVKDKLDVDVEYLVVDELKKTSGIEKKAAALNQKGASISTIAGEHFLEMLLPTNDELRALLLGEKKSREHLDGLFWSIRRARQKSSDKVRYPKYDCSGIDLRGAKIDEFIEALEHLVLDGADLREAQLKEQVTVPPLKSVDLRKARIYGHLHGLKDCNCAGTNLRFSLYHGKTIEGCDFTRAEMGHFWFQKASVIDCTFTKCRLDECSAERIKADGLDFSGASLKEAEFERASLKLTDFTGADFRKADLRKVNFEGANLTKVKFAGANLMQADLSNATIDGADFTGADIAKVKWEGVDKSKAKGLPAELQTKPVQAGPKVRELSQLAMKSSRVEVVMEAETPTDMWNMQFVYDTGMTSAWWHKSDAGMMGPGASHQRFPSMQDAIVHVAEMLSNAKLQPDTLFVRGSKTGISNKKLKTLAHEALSEAFGVEVASAEAIEELRRQKDSAAGDLATTMLSEIGGGPHGIKKFAARDFDQKNNMPPCQHADLRGKVLDGLHVFGKANFDGSNFDKATLEDATIHGSFQNATFRSAKMAGCNLSYSEYNGADFTGADLRNARFGLTRLRGATLKKADLTGADLHAARLQRADLSGAKIDDIAYRRSNIWSEHNPVTTFSTAEFDEDTRFPETGRFPEGLIWAGSGIDPRNKDAWAIASKASACSPKELLVVLKAMPWDGSRISSALDMLKAEQFELFADSTKEHVIGVIRSQRDPGLVYACRLSNSGAFSCCTQNLRACGGLRGALCKHLLVLLLGLAKDGRLPANRIADWIVASRSQKPKLDKEVMSDTFIRYKGAEAGDIDWRPVETVPEDFYAF